mmetsp:Transcript_34205/g.33797  ORF Transcript_34205/g.33797 Transcript_34205/m.33797 type:complete len:234 (-) Transcript_34205:748-1449(-)
MASMSAVGSSDSSLMEASAISSSASFVIWLIIIELLFLFFKGCCIFLVWSGLILLLVFFFVGFFIIRIFIAIFFRFIVVVVIPCRMHWLLLVNSWLRFLHRFRNFNRSFRSSISRNTLVRSASLFRGLDLMNNFFCFLGFRCLFWFFSLYRSIYLILWLNLLRVSALGLLLRNWGWHNWELLHWLSWHHIWHTAIHVHSHHICSSWGHVHMICFIELLISQNTVKSISQTGIS